MHSAAKRRRIPTYIIQGKIMNPTRRHFVIYRRVWTRLFGNPTYRVYVGLNEPYQEPAYICTVEFASNPDCWMATGYGSVHTGETRLEAAQTCARSAGVYCFEV